MIRETRAELFLLGMLFIAGTASAETIELVTYYPAPGNTGDQHARSATVGTNYNGVTPSDGQAFIFDRLGIGPNFTAAAPPTQVLEVEGNVLANSAGTALFMADRGANMNYSGLQLLTAGTLKWTIGSRNDGTENLHVFSDADNATRLFIAQGTGNVGIGTATPSGRLHVQGTNDALSNVLFMPGNDTAAAGVPEIRVGIGTAAPNEKLDVSGNAHVSGNVQVDGTFNGAKGVFIDNLFVGSARTWKNNNSAAYVDVPDSVKTINLPAGTAVITYSLTGRTTSLQVGSGATALWHVRAVVGPNTSPDQVWIQEVQFSHTTRSGSWTTNVVGGSTTIKLQVQSFTDSNQPVLTDFDQNQYDSVSWTIVVYRD